MSELVLADELTYKQQAFVIEYLKDFNGTRAAERAGYGGTDPVLAAQASRLLKNVKIKTVLEQRLEELAMSAGEVIMRLAQQARNEASDYLTSKGLVNLNQLIADGKQHLIKGIRWDRSGNLVVEFYDAQSALQLLGRYHSLFSDRVKIQRDWRAEMEELGVDPSTVLDQLTNQAAATLANPEGLAGPGHGRSLGSGEATTQSEDELAD